MPTAAHDLIRLFFATMPGGKLHPDMFTGDFTAWTCSKGVELPGEAYLGGVRMLQSFFPGGLHYTVDSLIAEGDRAAADVHAQGTLANGENFANSYAFTFRLRDGKIAAVREYFNPAPVEEKIAPLIRAFMATQAG
ncbi:MAG: nuclear transport factor 2 family protein [Sphingomonadales bacterium]|nr:nuclear transport factor 2 family protein [Sphingomonadales bacterium]